MPSPTATNPCSPLGGWSMEWTGLKDMLHCLLWVAAVTLGGIPQAPISHAGRETANNDSEVVERGPLLSW